MPRTEPLIILAVGEAAIDTAASGDTHARADIGDLEDGAAVRNLKYATFEPDFWLLDGKFHFAPDPAHIGFVSDEISDADGEFGTDPYITLTLADVVDIEQGIALEFSRISGDYCDSINVEYQDNTTTHIYDKTYTVDKYNFFAEIADVSKPVEDVKYIVITFISTATAYRHVKLFEIYVDGVMFDKSAIQAATVLEEICLTSTELPANELEFTIYSEDDDLSIVNPVGVYAGLQENQRIEVYEYIDDTRIYMGQFYLKDWEAKTEHITSFIAYDAIYLAANIPPTYYEGGHYIYVTSGGGIDGFLEQTLDLLLYYVLYGVFTRDVDSGISSNSVTGYYPFGSSIRDALRHSALGQLAYVTCARSSDIRVVETELVADVVSWDHIFTTADIGENPKVAVKPLVTGVDLISHEYPLNSEHIDVQIYDGTLEIGEYVFEFPDEIYGTQTWTPSGTATYSDSSKVGFATVTVTGAGTYRHILKDTHAHNRELLTERMVGLAATVPENIIVIDQATMVTPYNAADVLEFLYDYFQQRYVVEFKVFAENVAPGDSVKVPVLGEELWGIAERIESDLVNGFVQKVTVVGEIN